MPSLPGTTWRLRTARGRGSAPPPGHSAHAPQAVCVCVCKNKNKNNTIRTDGRASLLRAPWRYLVIVGPPSPTPSDGSTILEGAA
eukprot:4254852-Prymnesium_polylepis.1